LRRGFGFVPLFPAREAFAQARFCARLARLKHNCQVLIVPVASQGLVFSLPFVFSVALLYSEDSVATGCVISDGFGSAGAALGLDFGLDLRQVPSLHSWLGEIVEIVLSVRAGAACSRE
jgi:hypothetical protein